MAYAVGATIAAAVFWLARRLGRRRSPPRSVPALPDRRVPSEPISVRTASTRWSEEVSSASAPPAYEPRDADTRAVGLVGIGFLIALGLTVVAATVLFLLVTDTVPVLQVPPPGVAISRSAPTPVPPPPRLETQPGQTLEPYAAREEVALNSYAWIDRSQGIVRIPIERAKDLIVESGLPTRPMTATVGYEDNGLTAPSGSSSGRANEERIR